MKDISLVDVKTLRGKRVLLRASLNVPVERGVITNTYRLEESLKTIELLARAGARVVVCGHLGREKTDSLRVVWEELKRRTSTPVSFSPEVVGERTERAALELNDGEVLLLENVRREPGETTNDLLFAKKLARLAEFYVNDAFSDSHRTHASIVGVAHLLPHAAGPNFMHELSMIERARTPASPSLAVVGGAKFLTKEPLIETLLARYDHVLVGGALAHDFFVAKGLPVGRSLVSGAFPKPSLLKNSKLMLPVDVVVERTNERVTKAVEEVDDLDTILDVGPETLERVRLLTEKARFILWNGPLGNFERGFSQGTEALAALVAASPAQSVVGGGDTIAAIERLRLAEKFTHVSTAGGAMLQFIADGTLPGIEALR